MILLDHGTFPHKFMECLNQLDRYLGYKKTTDNQTQRIIWQGRGPKESRVSPSQGKDRTALWAVFSVPCKTEASRFTSFKSETGRSSESDLIFCLFFQTDCNSSSHHFVAPWFGVHGCCWLLIPEQMTTSSTMNLSSCTGSLSSSWPKLEGLRLWMGDWLFMSLIALFFRH